MKKTVIAGVAIGILAVGGIGGNLIVSQMLENRIRDSISNPPAGMQSQCDDVRVSLLQRTIGITNLRLSGPEGELGCRELLLRPTLSLMLAGGIPSLQSLLPTSGPVVMGGATARDITLRSASSEDDATDEVSLKTLTVSEAYLDAALFAELLQKKRRPALPDFVEKAGAGRLEAAQLRLRSGISTPLSVEALSLDGIVVGTRIDLVAAEQFMIADADQRMGGSLRLTDIALPATLARQMFANAVSSREIEQTLLAVEPPFYRTLTLENNTFVSDGMTITCRRIVHDWRSNTPPHSVSRIEQLDIPIDSAPGLQRLRINSEGEHAQRGELFRDRGSIDIADVGRLEIDLEHNINVSELSFEESDLLALLGAQLRKASLRYEDKGGIALLLTVFIDNKENISQMVDMLAAQLPAALPGEANRPLVEALRTTLLTPGTLELSLRDGKAAQVADLMDIHHLGRRIEAKAVPGKENVKAQLLRMLRQ